MSSFPVSYQVFLVFLFLHFPALSFLFVVAVVTQPLPRDEGTAEDHGVPEAGQLPRSWTRGRRETESRQRVSGAKSP